MKSCLMLFHVSKVATLTQVKVFYFQPYFHMCIYVLQQVSNIGIAVFAHLHMNIITSMFLRDSQLV